MRFFLLFFLILGAGARAQLVTNVSWTEQSSLNPANVIYYDPQYELKWDDFQGKPVEGGRTAAVTVSGFGYKADIKTRNGRGELNIDVYCYFQKTKSWVKPGKTIPYILNHEQHHFNISYIAANIFMERLKRSKFTTSNFNDLLPKIYAECCDIMNAMQEDYDGQTHNGQLKSIQEEWNAILSGKLDDFTR